MKARKIRYSKILLLFASLDLTSSFTIIQVRVIMGSGGVSELLGALEQSKNGILHYFDMPWIIDYLS